MHVTGIQMSFCDFTPFIWGSFSHIRTSLWIAIWLLLWYVDEYVVFVRYWPFCSIPNRNWHWILGTIALQWGIYYFNIMFKNRAKDYLDKIICIILRQLNMITKTKQSSQTKYFLELKSLTLVFFCILCFRFLILLWFCAGQTFSCWPRCKKR